MAKQQHRKQETEKMFTNPVLQKGWEDLQRVRSEHNKHGKAKRA